MVALKKLGSFIRLIIHTHILYSDNNIKRQIATDNLLTLPDSLPQF